jgi:putative ABC transport system permease protein
MFRVLCQSYAIFRIKAAGMRNRAWLALTTMFAISLVVSVLLSLSAMREGFQHVLSDSGSSAVAVLTHAGSQNEINSVVTLEQVRLLESASGVAVDAEGRKALSSEFYMIVGAQKIGSDATVNLALRGLDLEGVHLRDGAVVEQGRLFQPSAREIVIGKALLGKYEGFNLGGRVRLGSTEWSVVGVFGSGGGVMENEIWASLVDVQQQFKRAGAVQTIRARLDGPDGLARLRAYIAGDPRLNLDAVNEHDFYASQSGQTSDLIQKLGWPLGLLVAVGALVSAMSTMQSSVDLHASEIRTLRTIGFGRIATFVGTMLEAVALSGAGALAGLTVTWLALQGATASTLSSGLMAVSFQFRLTPAIIAQSLALALAAGLVGSVIPAVRMTRAKLVGEGGR